MEDRRHQDAGLDSVLSAFRESRRRRGEAAASANSFDVPEDTAHLDTLDLARLTEAFRAWAGRPRRADVRASRQRILLLYLLLRYTGAKLGEILSLDLGTDFDEVHSLVRVGRTPLEQGREVSLPAELVRELSQALRESDLLERGPEPLRVDEAHVRRKFYERADECGLSRESANPSALRRSRAVELLRDGVPLTVVQSLLGHSTANLTASLLSFSEQESREITQRFLNREQNRTSSARNAFFGKITKLVRDEIQAELGLVTLGGHEITSVITIESVVRMGLAPGRLVTAEVKAPWITLSDAPRKASARNQLAGTVTRMRRGEINSEVTLQLTDGTELCAILSTGGLDQLGLRLGDQAWGLFDVGAVIVHVR
ncbi:MAG: TOBE domain-containing protein [Desulfovibrio sp.]